MAALATIPLTVVQLQGAEGPAILAADWGIWSVFVVDYAIALGTARDRRAAARREWLTLLVIVLSFPALPALLALTRLARLVRVVRVLRALRLTAVLARGFRALRLALGHRGLLYVAATSAFLVVAGGGLVALVEPETVGRTMWEGIWWALVTVTTVGYGDAVPLTPLGRIVAGLLMIVGIGLVATLAASVAAYFVGKQEAVEDAVEHAMLRDITARLERLESLVRDAAERDDRPTEDPPPPS